MRRLALLLAAALIAGCGGDDEVRTTTVTEPAAARATPETGTPAAVPRRSTSFDPEAIYEELSPGVVTVVALGGGRSNLFGRSTESLGSGFVVGAQGFIATNAHVVTSDSGAKARSVYVEFSDGNRLDARIVGADPNSDVAVLKVDPSKLRGSKLVPLDLGRTAGLSVGDPVAAIGSPFGEQQSLSIGVVSALNRDIESLTSFRIGNAIQTDAAINHGNSGGPLLDARGRVIGINAQIRSTGGGGEGVGFAIPIETAKRAIDQLRADGEATYAYLGISSVSLYPQLAERLGFDEITGALIDRVEDGGPADDAGLRGAESRISFQGTPRVPVGSDLIVAVDGKRLTRSADLADVVGVHRPGETVAIEIVRDGNRRTVRVELGERPDRPARER